MIVCASLSQAASVPNVVLIVASTPPVAYQVGDVLPSYAVLDPVAVAAELSRESIIDSNIATTTIGATQPATVAQLKAMALADYSAWFDANFTSASLLIALLKRLTLVVIRRVL